MLVLSTDIKKHILELKLGASPGGVGIFSEDFKFSPPWLSVMFAMFHIWTHIGHGTSLVLNLNMELI